MSYLRLHPTPRIVVVAPGVTALTADVVHHVQVGVCRTIVKAS
jgi:hypothetical protein